MKKNIYFFNKKFVISTIDLILIIIAVVIGCYSEYKDYFNYNGSGMTKAQYEQVQQQKKKQEEHQKIEDGKKLPEFREAFNTVMSNTIGPIYSGCRIDAFNSAYIYINPDWYTLTEEQRKVIIDRVIKVYNGMIGARKIQSMQNKNVYMYFVDPVSEKEVGKWDYISGASISK